MEGALTQVLTWPYSEEKHIETYKEMLESNYLHLRKIREAPTQKVTPGLCLHIVQYNTRCHYKEKEIWENKA